MKVDFEGACFGRKQLNGFPRYLRADAGAESFPNRFFTGEEDGAVDGKICLGKASNFFLAAEVTQETGAIAPERRLEPRDFFQINTEAGDVH